MVAGDTDSSVDIYERFGSTTSSGLSPSHLDPDAAELGLDVSLEQVGAFSDVDDDARVEAAIARRELLIAKPELARLRDLI